MPDKPFELPQTLSSTDAAGILGDIRAKNEQPVVPDDDSPPPKGGAEDSPAHEAEDADLPGDQGLIGDEPDDEPAEIDEPDDEPELDLTDEDDDTAGDQPAIEAPSSWTQAEREAFAELPPAVQKTLSDRERERDLNIRRTQNEAAEIRKSAEAAQSKAQELEKFYHEQALPSVQAEIEQFVAREFADIQSQRDLDALRINDPGRYLQFEALAQQRMAKIQQQRDYQARQEQERAEELEKFRKSENQKFLELAPEYGDPKKVPQLHQQVRQMFNDVGIPDEEAAKIFSGDGLISVHDHRTQLIIRDAMRYRAAQARAKTARKKPAPTVQRPGTRTSPRERASEDVVNLNKRLDRTGSREDAVALLRAARRRR